MEERNEVEKKNVERKIEEEKIKWCRKMWIDKYEYKIVNEVDCKCGEINGRREWSGGKRRRGQTNTRIIILNRRSDKERRNLYIWRYLVIMADTRGKWRV